MNEWINTYIHTYIYKERKNAAAQFKKDMCTPTFTKAKVSIHQKMYSGILFSHMKKTNATTYNNMDAARGYYGQWNKPHRERKVSNDFTHLWSIRKKKKSVGTRQY